MGLFNFGGLNELKQNTSEETIKREYEYLYKHGLTMDDIKKDEEKGADSEYKYLGSFIDGFQDDDYNLAKEILHDAGKNEFFLIEGDKEKEGPRTYIYVKKEKIN
jgi:hypothetical protein